MKKQKIIYFGGDYNPDQWDEKTIDRDMELFGEAGVSLVVLPVFSWAKLEPEEGRYEFGWLDEILERDLESWDPDLSRHSHLCPTCMDVSEISGDPAGRYIRTGNGPTVCGCFSVSTAKNTGRGRLLLRARWQSVMHTIPHWRHGTWQMSMELPAIVKTARESFGSG